MAEQRRTGYPKLFKVQNNTGKVIDTDIMIRRLPFSTDAATADPAQYATLTEKLGGADNGATALVGYGEKLFLEQTPRNRKPCHHNGYHAHQLD